MNRTTILRALATAVAVLGIASAALAGSAYSGPVSVGAVTFSGALVTAQHAANSIEYIDCAHYETIALCAARDASYRYGACATTKSEHLELIRSLPDSGYLRVRHDASGRCTSVRVDRFSSELETLPSLPQITPKPARNRWPGGLGPQAGGFHSGALGSGGSRITGNVSGLPPSCGALSDLDLGHSGGSFPQTFAACRCSQPGGRPSYNCISWSRAKGYLESFLRFW